MKFPLTVLGALLILGFAPLQQAHVEALPHAQTPHPLGCIPSDAEKNFIDQVLAQLNAYRLANGLNALAYDMTMQQAMEGHCHHMPVHPIPNNPTDPLYHVHNFANEPESQTPDSRAFYNGAGINFYGENIAYGYTTPTDVMNGWRASPPHNQNMLDPSYTRVGVGYYSNGNFWGQLFGLGAAVAPPGTTPFVVTPAAANPSPVAGTTTNLSVVGGDDGGESNLRYTWRTTGAPPASVIFSANGTNAAKNTTATFSAAGNYSFQVTIMDVGGLIAVSNVNVTVNQTTTAITVTPTPVSVQINASLQFTAVAQDQFGANLSPQPAFGWSTSGGGVISGTGLFTAGATPGGPHTITASNAGVNGMASVTVLATAPTLTTIVVSPASASVTTGGTRQFSAVGLDQVGNPMFPQPAFAWTVSGGGTISGTGHFTAGGTAGGPHMVTATSGAVNGTASVTVTNPPSNNSSSGWSCGATGMETVLLMALVFALRRRKK